MGEVNVSISPELIKPIIVSEINAAIVAQISRYPTFVAEVVAAALQRNVDERGEATTSTYHVAPYIDWLARKIVREIAEQAIREVMQEQRPQILTAIKAQIGKGRNAFAKALLDGSLASMRHEWMFKVTLADDKKET